MKQETTQDKQDEKKDYMERYFFNDVVFTPDEAKKLTIGGKVVRLSKMRVKALRFFLDNNGRIIDKDDIIYNVWGAGSHSHGALTTALCRLNKVLAPHASIETVTKEGHILDVKLTVHKIAYVKTKVVEVQPRSIKSTITMVLLGVLLSVTTATGVSQWFKPPVAYTLKGSKDFFIADNIAGYPQLSPNGDYVAFWLANKRHEHDYLAIISLKSGETQLLVKMGFDDGFKWGPNGDKMVYQRRSDNDCQIRLLQFNGDKTVTADTLLHHCPLTSGGLSFAWYNDHVFYVNAVDGESAALPLHQLYSFDINNKQLTKVLATEREGGVGFYSLEYDRSANALYFLKVNHGMTSDFYRYQNGALTKQASLDHLLPFYTVDDGRLIYRNAKNDLVLNQPSADFTQQKILMPSLGITVATPHLSGNQLTFMLGETFGFGLHQWTNGTIAEVALGGFDPYVIANYKETLIFASNQTGTYKLYQLQPQGGVKPLGDMQQSDIFKDITVVGEVFAASYYNRVDFYHFRDEQLVLFNSLSGYSNAFINHDATRVLLAEVKSGKPNGTVIELRLADMQPTGLALNEVKMAMYQQGDVVYVSEQQQLKRVVNDQPVLLAEDIQLEAFEQSTLHNNQLYYITSQAGAKTVMGYDFASGITSTLELNGVVPSRIAMLNDALYIRTRQLFGAKLMVGTVSIN